MTPRRSSRLPRSSVCDKHSSSPEHSPTRSTHFIEFTDPGSRANPQKPNLLGKASAVKQISTYIGSEIEGVQVSQLSKEGLDELALLVAERKVVVFRDQDFKDLTPERQIEIARYDCPRMSVANDSD